MDSPKDEEKLELPDGDGETPPSKVVRRVGFLEGQFTIPDDFKEFGRAEIEEMFYGEPDKFSDLRDEDSPENSLKARAFKATL